MDSQVKFEAKSHDEDEFVVEEEVSSEETSVVDNDKCYEI